MLKALSVEEKITAGVWDQRGHTGPTVESRRERGQAGQISHHCGARWDSAVFLLSCFPSGLHFRNAGLSWGVQLYHPGRLPQLEGGVDSDHIEPPPFYPLLSGFQLTDSHGQVYDISSTPDEEEGKRFPQKPL